IGMPSKNRLIPQSHSSEELWEGGNALRNADVVHGVDRAAVDMDLKVQMGASGPAGGANIADDLALGDIVAHGDGVVGHMAVDAAIAGAMAERHIVAVGIAVGGGGYRTGGNGVNRRTLRGRQVNAAVEPTVAPNGMDPPAIG